jgi:hypothetical protein
MNKFEDDLIIHRDTGKTVGYISNEGLIEWVDGIKPDNIDLQTISGATAWLDAEGNRHKIERPKVISSYDTYKEEINYLVKFEYSNYYITIDGIILLTDKDKEFFDSLKPEEDDYFYLMDSVGEKIEIEFNDYDEWRSCYTWTSISEEERKMISKLIGDRCGYFFYPEVE